MPVYDVNLPDSPYQAWNLQVGPPGIPGQRPPAQLVINGPAQEVMMGNMANIALNQQNTALFTRNLTDCSAFCILYRGPGAAWSRASLIHMAGGPDPAGVNWAAMVNGMPAVPGATFFAILANSNATVLTDPFLTAVAQNLQQIPANNIWVYNQRRMAINFGIDFGAFAGEVQ